LAFLTAIMLGIGLYVFRYEISMIYTNIPEL